MASFVRFIDEFDAKYGIPRPADSPHLTAFHSFIRISRHISVGVVLLLCGIVSSYLLWQCANWLEVSGQTRLLFVVGMLVCLCVSFFEIVHEVLPYYRIKQRLTFGTARWADEPYLKGMGFAVKINPDLSNLPPGAIRVAKLRRGYDLVLPVVEWLRHLAIFGPPGSGKSKTFLMSMLRDLARGGSAIILDPKGELYEQTAGAFRQVYRLDLLNPSRSDRWNFLPQCKNDHEFASQMAATMIGLEGTKVALTDPFWQESSLLLLTTVLLHLSDVVAYPTPPMVFEYLGMRDMAAIDAEMSNTKNTTVRMNWGALKKGSDGTKGNVFTTLMNKLAPFEIKNAQAVCAPITEADREAGVRQIDFKKLRKAGTAIYVVVAEGDATRYKNVLSTFFGQAVNELRLDEEETPADEVAPVAFCLDEAANVPITGLKEFAGVGRGRRMGLWLGYQNMPQTQDQYNHDGANAILGSIGCTLFLPGLDDATTQFCSRRIGQATVWSHTTIDAKGKKNDSERQSETGRALMDPTEVRQMVKHQQCVFIIDTSPPIRASYPPLAVQKVRALTPRYPTPKLVSLIDAEEEMIEAAAQQYRQKRLAAAVAAMERGELLDDAPTVSPDSFEEREAVAPDAVYQGIFQRLSDGQLPEPKPEAQQSPFAKIVKARFETGQISKWEDLRALDIKVMKRLGMIKRGLPLDGIAEEVVELGGQQPSIVAPVVPPVAVPAPPPADGQAVGSIVVAPSPVAAGAGPNVPAAVRVVSTPPPPVSLSTSRAQSGLPPKKGTPNQNLLFELSNELVEKTVGDAARVQITNKVRADGGKRAIVTASVDSYRGGGPKIPADAMLNSGRGSGVQDALR